MNDVSVADEAEHLTQVAAVASRFFSRPEALAA